MTRRAEFLCLICDEYVETFVERQIIAEDYFSVDMQQHTINYVQNPTLCVGYVHLRCALSSSVRQQMREEIMV